MAGPGIRYHNIAEQLRKVSDVTLAVYSDSSDSSESDILKINKTGETYRQVFDKFDVIFAQWLSGEMLDYAKSSGITVIIDLYAPVPIEYLASLEFSNVVADAQKDLEFSGIIETCNKYLASAVFFVYSNDR